MENFVQTNLRIITRQSFRELWALFHPLEVKAQVYEFLRERVIYQSNIDSLYCQQGES